MFISDDRQGKKINVLCDLNAANVFSCLQCMQKVGKSTLIFINNVGAKDKRRSFE